MFRTGGGGAGDKSVLDLVGAHARSLRRKVSRSDRRKVDEYLDAVRAIERRLEFAEAQSLRVLKEKALSDTLMRPEPGIPVSSGIFKSSTGRVMRRTELSNGTIIETDVYAGDYRDVPGAKPNKAGDVPMRLVPTPAPIAPPSR